MPKKFTPKEPIDKLPLAVRKEIRDNYDPKKEDCEVRIASALRLDKFTLDFNANEIWAYNKVDYQNPGYLLASFAEGFTNALEAFAKAYGDEGIEEFNAAVSKSELTVKVNEFGDDAALIGVQIRDGVFQLLFNHEKLGHHASSLLKDDIVNAIDALPRENLTLEAKHSITIKWKAECEELRRDIADMVGIPDLVLDGNFEENYRKVYPAKKGDLNFQRNFGYASFAYFNGLRSRLGYDKVKEDEMLQEGIQEVLANKIIKLRAVDQPKSGSYQGIACEDGILYLETTPERWGFNANEVAEKLISSL